MPVLLDAAAPSTGAAAAIADASVVAVAKLFSAPRVGSTVNESPGFIVPVVEKFKPLIGWLRLVAEPTTLPVELSVSV